MLYGKSDLTRIADPRDGKKIFDGFLNLFMMIKEIVQFMNTKRKMVLGIDTSKLHNKNRTNGNASFTNVYLKKIRYGNVSPYKKHGDPIPDKWMFENSF